MAKTKPITVDTVIGQTEADALTARIDHAAMAQAAEREELASATGGFEAAVLRADSFKLEADDLMVWQPQRERSTQANAFNDLINSLHHEVAPFASSITTATLARYLRLAVYASPASAVAKAKETKDSIPARTAPTVDDGPDFANSKASAAALVRIEAGLEQSNSASAWARNDIAMATAVLNAKNDEARAGAMVALAKAVNLRRKHRAAWLANLFLPFCADEIRDTCAQYNVPVGNHWNAAVLAARSAHSDAFKATRKTGGKLTSEKIVRAIQFAAHQNIVDAVTTAKKAQAALVKTDGELATALALRTIDALRRLHVLGGITEASRDQMIATIKDEVDIKEPASKADETAQQLAADQQEAADRNERAAKNKPAAKQATEVKAAKATKVPAATGKPTFARKGKPAAPVAPVATVPSVLDELEDDAA